MARLLIFDLLRIMAIVLVVIAHVAQTLSIPILDGFYGIPNFYFVSPGGMGVTILLVVSGASLCLNHQSVNDYTDFIIKRLCRIYPAYWCSLILILLIYAVASRMPYLAPKDLVLSITGMYAFFREWGGPINSVSWFIGLIVILYLMYPFIMPMFQKHGYIALFVLLVISVWSRWFFGHDDGRLTDWFPLCRVFEFGLGIFIVKRGVYPKTLTTSRAIYVLSSLSFYVFLIHYPLLFVIKTNPLLYATLVMLLSYFVYALDDKLIQTAIIIRHRGPKRGQAFPMP
jgi:peptidoglycan/LPS O-acetylase OafA/YrhL